MKKLFALLDNEKVLLVVSLLIAVVLWMVVISDRNPTDTDVLRAIPVTHINAENVEASGLNVISMSADSTDVKISGRLTELQNISRQNVAATIDMSQIYSPGYYDLPISITQTKSGISVESFEPKSVTVRIDYIETNKRDVEVRFTGTLPEGIEISDAKPAVSSVTIEGPEKTVDSIVKAVATVDVSEVTDSGTVNSPIKLLDASGMEITDSEIKVSSASTTVDLTVVRLKTVPIQVILSGEVDVAGSGISVNSTPAQIVIKGAKDIIEAVEKIDTEAILHIPESDAVISAALLLPDGIASETESVNVAFTIEQTVENDINVNEN